jgi:hypothetical protein
MTLIRIIFPLTFANEAMLIEHVQADREWCMYYLNTDTAKKVSSVSSVYKGMCDEHHVSMLLLRAAKGSKGVVDDTKKQKIMDIRADPRRVGGRYRI